ncbi:cytidine deaminase [Anaerolineales bacterium HSG25]|nr:cytidine deaminase [Anaerolineales bacterium HSG25]
MSVSDKSEIDWPALLEVAIRAREASYSPYSNYLVGAALLTGKNEIYTGCNIENAGYSGTVCAERVAIFKAISVGEYDFRAMAVVTIDGAFPCGVCRQVIREFVTDLPILIGDTNRQYSIYGFKELLPYGFGPENLKNL